MKLNHRKQQIMNEFYTKVKNKFPEIEYKELLSNPEDKEHIWIIVTSDMDEDKEEEFMDYEAGLEADIHLDFGYRMSIMLENKRIFAS